MTIPLVVSVLGGGSFGTAIANIVAANGHKTFLWMRDESRARQCQESRENAEYLPGYPLHYNVTVTSCLADCVALSSVIAISVPSSSFRQVTRLAAPHIKDHTIVISTTKGIEGDGFLLMSQILEQELSNARIGVLSGPNFAKEIIDNQYTGSVVASDDASVLKCIQKAFSSSTFRVYSNGDRYGVELAGALKNIYAIVTGMATALGCGSNTTAMLLTRSLAEMSRLARRLGANPMTFLGLAGMGDLVLTCTSKLSRNYRVGYALGKGKRLSDTLDELGQVAEGVNTLPIVKRKSDQLGVYMPLVTGLDSIIYHGRDIAEVVTGLMCGEMTSDVDLRGGVV